VSNAAAVTRRIPAPDGSRTRVLVLDTTLRDGEQAPGCAMTPAEKLCVARALAALRVDIIEAGFPAASDGDWAAVRGIAAEVGCGPDAPVVCALARATTADIERAASAVALATKARIHTFIATSDVHIRHKLATTRDAVLHRVREMVAHAGALCADIEFSPEDATRSDRGFLFEVLAAAVEAGATTLNIPDTVGYAMPDEYESLIRAIVRRHPAPVVVSTHCHDDLGMAVANTLSGVRAGARQIECTMNGLGERAGNAALEEVVVALAARRDAHRVATGIRLAEIGAASRTVAECSGAAVPPNKAVVGANAFAHESGIHQDGVLKHRRTYEILDAESLGLTGARLVLGKHSGRHAFRHHLNALGHALSDDEVEIAFRRFKEAADGNKALSDRDIIGILRGEAARAAQSTVREATVDQPGPLQ
jgi:2-isopropylmalate synthase